MRSRPHPPPRPVLFGKLPGQLDFVRVNASLAPALDLDAVLRGALEDASRQRGWQERMDASPTLEVCHPVQGFLLGVLVPSRDQAGRRYPLVAAMAAPVPRGSLAWAPLAWEGFLEGLRRHLEGLALRDRDAEALERFLAGQAGAWEAGLADLPLAGEIVARTMAATPATALGGRPLRQTLLNLLFFRDFLRRFGPTAPGEPGPLLRLPLGGGPGEASLHAAVWLTLLSLLTGGPWPHAYGIQRSGTHPRLLTTFGQGGPWPLLEALGGQPPREAVLDLDRETAPWRNHRLYPETAYALDRVLATPGPRLADLGAFLEAAARRLATAGA